MRSRGSASGRFFVTLLLGFAVSGCVGDGNAQELPSPSVAAPPEVDVDTGAVEGIVHDDSLVPLDGAQLALADAELTTVSDATGRFTFSNVAPGDHQLFVARLGFDSVAKRLNVVAGEVTTVDVTLTAIPITEPWSTVQSKRGIFGCGASWRPQDPATGGGIAACGVFSLYANNTQFDQFYLAWDLSATGDIWKGAVFETEWQSNQVLGQGLWPLWEPLDCSIRFAEAEGRSPIRTRLGEIELTEKLERASKSRDNDCKENCDDEDNCRFQSRMFPSAQSLGPTYPADISV
ncbi:MAG TPA: carboxypeptidase-like regulatory domain-containing protein, partial [Candidatus Thermoplasmatota archaeon]